MKESRNFVAKGTVSSSHYVNSILQEIQHFSKKKKKGTQIQCLMRTNPQSTSGPNIGGSQIPRKNEQRRKPAMKINRRRKLDKMLKKQTTMCHCQWENQKPKKLI